MIVGAAIVALVDGAIGEERFGKGNATHLEAFHPLWLKPLPYDDLCAAATNIDHQAGLHVLCTRVGYPKVNESGLLTAVDDVDPGAEETTRRDSELLSISGNAQCVCSYHSYAFWFDTLQQLGESAQAGQTAFNGIAGQPLVFQPGPQLYFFSQGLDGPHLAVFDLGDYQVERVTAKVDGSQQAAIGQGVDRFVG